jgi:hypothetical protein
MLHTLDPQVDPSCGETTRRVDSVIRDPGR